MQSRRGGTPCRVDACRRHPKSRADRRPHCIYGSRKENEQWIVGSWAVAGLWLNLEHSCSVTNSSHKLCLDVVEFYEDGFEFSRDSVEITAESQYIGAGSSVTVGSDNWAPGRYWVYLYDGDRKVAHLQYEVTP